MSDSESVNDNKGNEPSKETAFNSHWETDDESETLLEKIIPFNSHLEVSNDEGDKPFVEITSFNSGKKLCELIYKVHNITNNIRINCKIDTPNFCYKESSNDNSDDSDLDVPKSPVNLDSDFVPNTQVTKTIRHIIYDSLFEYWNEPIMIGLLASLLDPYLKTLSSWDEETQEKAKAELKHQFETLISSNNNLTASMYANSKNNKSIH
ncbi:121_t:CDS:2, partial [Gigaspora margarita]